MNHDLSQSDREWLKKSCAESGVPERVTDPETVLKAAEVLRPVRGSST